MALDREQQQVLSRILAIGRRRGASPMEVKAAVATGLVESGLRNLNHGDADSKGWRQERASLYKDPTNLDASINRFFDETAAVRGKYGRAGDLAAAVQRPAAQYRGRYQERSAEADALIGGASRGTSRRTSGRTSDGSTRTITTTTPGVDNRAARAQLILNFLSEKGSDPVAFATQARALRDIAPTSNTTTQQIGGGGSGAGGAAASGQGGLAAFATERANIINNQRLPYKWGGGHGGQTRIKDPVPLDCSGAVSKVLGIDPRVSGDFQKWGRAGDGGDTGVTVYANPTHVLMKINGRFFGTSASNPGGGAGWIPEEQISDEYLSKFTARHSKR